MPLRFDFIVEKLKRRKAGKLALVAVKGSADRSSKPVSTPGRDVVEPIQVDTKRRRTA